MALPNVAISIQSAGIGISQPNPGSTALESGWSTAGPGGVLNAMGDTASLQATYVSGPMVESAAYLLACGAPQVICLRIYDGTQGAYVKVGTGSLTATSSGSPIAAYGNPTGTGSTGPILLISLGGNIGTATFKYSLDGGKTYSSDILTAATNVLPNTGLTVTWGGTAGVLADTYTSACTTTVGTASAVSQVGPTGGAQGAGLITTTGSVPNDTYNVIAKIISTGALGVGTFQWSLDGGLTFSSTTLIPSGGGPLVLGNTGVQLTFANVGGAGGGTAFQAGDLYSFNTTQPSYTTTDITNVLGLGSTVNSPLTWGWIHLVGRPSSAAAAATVASTVDTQVSNWVANGRFCFYMVETPPDLATNSIDATLITAFASFTSDRACIGAGDNNLVSALSGSDVARNTAWIASGRCAVVPIGEDLGRTATPNPPGVVNILRDEAATPNLDAAGFTTMRTIRGLRGFYITNGRIMCAPTSNFTYIQFRRVMDVACNNARLALLQFLNSSVRINANGTIYEQDARVIERYVQERIAVDTTQAGQASAVTVLLSRTQNIQATSSEPVSIAITPLGYLKALTATIGFSNPALAVQS